MTMNCCRSFLSIVDIQCLATAGMMLCSNLLDMVLILTFRTKSKFNYEKMISLDPYAIIEQWSYRTSVATISYLTGTITAIAWFMILIPFIRVAWIQSSHGTYRIGLHIMIVSVVLCSSLTQVVAQLLQIGSQTGISWMAQGFQLDNWLGAGTGPDTATTNYLSTNTTTPTTSYDNEQDTTVNVDMIGWKTLEVVNNAINSMTLWIDSAQRVLISIAFILIYISVRDVSINTGRQREKQFNYFWSILGLIIAILCIFNFISDIVRFQAWYYNLFGDITFYVALVNRLVFIPMWLTWLAIQLPVIEHSYEYGTINQTNEDKHNYTSRSRRNVTNRSSSGHEPDTDSNIDDDDDDDDVRQDHYDFASKYLAPRTVIPHQHHHAIAPPRLPGRKNLV